MCRYSPVGIDSSRGHVLWKYNRLNARIAGSYTKGDLVFSVNGYGGGMVLLRLAQDREGIVAQEQYRLPFNFIAFQDRTVLGTAWSVKTAQTKSGLNHRFSECEAYLGIGCHDTTAQ